jgi:hypothetical protein
MNNKFIVFVLIILTIYFIVGMVFTMMMKLGIGIICFMSLLYLYYSKKSYIGKKAAELNPVDLYQKKKKESTYKKIKEVWAKVLKKYHPEMLCPHCKQEITIFTIDINGNCKSCGNKLI